MTVVVEDARPGCGHEADGPAASRVLAHGADDVRPGDPVTLVRLHGLPHLAVGLDRGGVVLVLAEREPQRRDRAVGESPQPRARVRGVLPSLVDLVDGFTPVSATATMTVGR